MDTPISNRIRPGALALGISALLFIAFPLLRPFFPFPSGNTTAEYTVVGQAYAMTSWVIAHLMAIVALILLLFGLLTLQAYVADSRGERRAFAGTVLGIAGIGLILPTVGVETYALPVIGRAYLDGKAELSTIVGSLYGGPDNIVMVLGLLLLAIGAILLAVAIWSSATLPKWAGVIFAIGLALWFPLFPQAARILDGLLVGIGGLWLAWSIAINRDKGKVNTALAPGTDAA